MLNLIVYMLYLFNLLHKYVSSKTLLKISHLLKFIVCVCVCVYTYTRVHTHTPCLIFNIRET